MTDEGPGGYIAGNYLGTKPVTPDPFLGSPPLPPPQPDVIAGEKVVAQSKDDSFWNTEPAVARGAAIAVVGAIGTVLVVTGTLDTEQVAVLKENAGAIAFSALTIIPILQAVWTRMAVWSGRTVAKIAVENAQSTTAIPTLAPPP